MYVSLVSKEFQKKKNKSSSNQCHVSAFSLDVVVVLHATFDPSWLNEYFVVPAAAGVVCWLVTVTASPAVALLLPLEGSSHPTAATEHIKMANAEVVLFMVLLMRERAKSLWSNVL